MSGENAQVALGRERDLSRLSLFLSLGSEEWLPHSLTPLGPRLPWRIPTCDG